MATNTAPTPTVAAREAIIASLRDYADAIREDTRKAIARDAQPSLTGMPKLADVQQAHDGLKPILALLTEAVKADASRKPLMDAVAFAMGTLSATGTALAKVPSAPALKPEAPANPFLGATPAPAPEPTPMRSHEDKTARVEPTTPPHKTDRDTAADATWWAEHVTSKFNLAERVKHLESVRSAALMGADVPAWSGKRADGTDAAPWDADRRQRAEKRVYARFS